MKSDKTGHSEDPALQHARHLVGRTLLNVETSDCLEEKVRLGNAWLHAIWALGVVGYCLGKMFSWW